MATESIILLICPFIILIPLFFISIKTSNYTNISALRNINDDLKNTAELIESFDYIGSWKLISECDSSSFLGVILLGFMSSDCGWVTASAFWFDGDDEYDEGFYSSIDNSGDLILMDNRYTHWTPSLSAPQDLINKVN